MKLLLATSILLLSVINLYGQNNSFKNCHENLKNSEIPFPDKNIQILQGLIGCKAPEFNVETITGENLNLSKLKGKVVVINFWFEGCAPCIAELPALNKLTEVYKGKDVIFIAFSKDDTHSIKEFLKRKEFNYKQVSSDYDLTIEYCIINGWPTNMVLDKNGILRQIFTGGYIDERAKIEAYNKMKPIIDKYL